jgi:nitroreductase
MARFHPVSGFDLDTVDRLLTTTRAVRRRLDFDRDVPLGVVRECLSLAVQAPTGSNAQRWRWLVITDPVLRERLGELYRDIPRSADVGSSPQPRSEQQRKMLASARFLMEHITGVPLFVLPCTEDVGRAAGWAPSIYPAVWSLILALRSRGLGSVITTAHLYRREEAATLLGVPEGYAQACLLPVAYYKGEDFQPADRLSVDEVTYLDRWGSPLPAS